MPNAQIIALLEGQYAAHQTRLAHYRDIPLDTLDALTADRDHSLQRLTLELGLAIENTYLRWLELALDTVRHLPEAVG